MLFDSEMLWLLMHRFLNTLILFSKSLYEWSPWERTHISGDYKNYRFSSTAMLASKFIQQTRKEHQGLDELKPNCRLFFFFTISLQTGKTVKAYIFEKILKSNSENSINPIQRHVQIVIVMIDFTRGVAVWTLQDFDTSLRSVRNDIHIRKIIQRIFVYSKHGPLKTKRSLFAMERAEDDVFRLTQVLAFFFWGFLAVFRGLRTMILLSILTLLAQLTK